MTSPESDPGRAVDLEALWRARCAPRRAARLPTRLMIAFMRACGDAPCGQGSVERAQLAALIEQARFELDVMFEGDAVTVDGYLEQSRQLEAWEAELEDER